MGQTMAPIHATRENLGRVVIVQVFNRRSPHNDNIDSRSLRKFTGKLQSFSFDKDGFTFKIRGLKRVTVEYAYELVEIYLP